MLSEWGEYERWYGPLLLHERIDFAGAQIAFIAARAAGAKDVEFTDFLPKWGSRSEPESEDQLLGKLLAFRDRYQKE